MTGAATDGGLTLEAARQLDHDDPLARFRDRFVIGDDLVAYLDGNSLGRLPRRTVGRVQDLLEWQWGQRLIRGWGEGWAELPQQVGDRLGSVVLGAAAGQTIIADSTTVNLFKVLHSAAALRPERTELVIDEANFPTDRYVVDAVARARDLVVRWIPADATGGVTPDSLSAWLGPDTAAAVLSHVDYRSSFLADVGALTACVHEAGALAVWDLSHSAGVVPTCLDDDLVDFAVGCTYKYLNAGPGSPAFLYVAARHLDAVSQPIAGWFGADDIFAMEPGHRPAAGIRRMLSGTPNVIGSICVDAGLDAVSEAGVERIRAKSVALTELARSLCDAILGPLGWAFVSPVDPARRGSHVVVTGVHAEEVTRRMMASGAVPDFRRPDLVRLGLSPLTTTFAEVWKGVQLLSAAIMDRRS